MEFDRLIFHNFFYQFLAHFRKHQRFLIVFEIEQTLVRFPSASSVVLSTLWGTFLIGRTEKGNRTNSKLVATLISWIPYGFYFFCLYELILDIHSGIINKRSEML